MTILEKIKTSLRITTDAFNDELTDIIEAGKLDLGVAGVDLKDVEDTNPLLIRALTTYAKAEFGNPDEYERIKASYNEQKAQLSMCTGYTDWNVQKGE